MPFDVLSVRPATYAAMATFVTLVFTVIALSTPYWLATDGRAPSDKFQNLGLWEACLVHFRDKNYLYDREFHGCHWLFDEDYWFLWDLLEPGFFITTQILYTIGFLLLLIAVIGVLAIQLCFIVDREAFAMKVLGFLMFISGLFTTTAVVLFGIYGDDRDWMPDPEHNFLSWSFALAVVGCFFQWISAILFWVESRILYKREMKRDQQSFDMSPQALGRKI
ncbi:hypothetical protein HDE_01538 [Halotydeus destructor]|nr:hypothetical protein HDE_01538 [Halotydeus destructor]